MEVSVKVFGTLRERFPSYQPSEGIQVELPDGATVADLFVQLGLPESQRPVAITGGRVLKGEEELRPGALVNVMQAISGG